MRGHIPGRPMTRSYGVLAVIASLTVIAGVGAAGASTAPAGKAAPPPGKQIAALKRENARLKRENAQLKNQVAALKKQVAALSPAGVAAQLTQTKTALEKYQSVDAAKADGYSGVGEPCVASPEGGMGIHYVSEAAMRDGKFDPAKPEILLYAPGPSGLQLLGAEYFKPDADQNLATDNDRPALLGRAFDGPMPGHNPTMPIHYDLHVWLFKRNPAGIFAVWNPDVRCG